MAKPGNRSKSSQNRPSYKKILKQQEQETQDESIVDQIAALEALLGGAPAEEAPAEVVEAAPQVDPEEQKRLEEERAAQAEVAAKREEERSKERAAREEERRKLQQELIKQQEDREARYKEEQEKLKSEQQDKKNLRSKLPKAKKSLSVFKTLTKLAS